MAQRQHTFTAAQAAQMLDYIDDEYGEEYLNLPTPIEPLFRKDSSHSTHHIKTTEPLTHHDLEASSFTSCFVSYLELFFDSHGNCILDRWLSVPKQKR